MGLPVGLLVQMVCGFFVLLDTGPTARQVIRANPCVASLNAT